MIGTQEILCVEYTKALDPTKKRNSVNLSACQILQVLELVGSRSYKNYRSYTKYRPDVRTLKPLIKDPAGRSIKAPPGRLIRPPPPSEGGSAN